MNAVEVVRDNFNSWSHHDSDAFVEAFTEGGVYITPAVGEPLTGAAIGYFSESVWTMYPDFSLDPISICDAGGGVVVQWVAHGTNNGAFPDGSCSGL